MKPYLFPKNTTLSVQAPPDAPTIRAVLESNGIGALFIKPNLSITDPEGSLDFAEFEIGTVYEHEGKPSVEEFARGLAASLCRFAAKPISAVTGDDPPLFVDLNLTIAHYDADVTGARYSAGAEYLISGKAAFDPVFLEGFFSWALTAILNQQPAA